MHKVLHELILKYLCITTLNKMEKICCIVTILSKFIDSTALEMFSIRIYLQRSKKPVRLLQIVIT